MKIIERYSTAVRSSNLSTDARTDYADTDVLGAMGLADRELTEGKTWDGRPIPKAEIAVPLERLFMGDNKAAMQIVEILAVKVWEKAKDSRVKLKRPEAVDLAKACLAWHRDSVCKACGGHGQGLIKGSTTLGGPICKPCNGTGRIPFASQFPFELRQLAVWLSAYMDNQAARAGPTAMRKIAPSLDL